MALNVKGARHPRVGPDPERRRWNAILRKRFVDSLAGSSKPSIPPEASARLTSNRPGRTDDVPPGLKRLGCGKRCTSDRVKRRTQWKSGNRISFASGEGSARSAPERGRHTNGTGHERPTYGGSALRSMHDPFWCRGGKRRAGLTATTSVSHRDIALCGRYISHSAILAVVFSWASSCAGT